MGEPVQDLDAVNRELAEVVDALNATPSDDFAARHALRTRQDQLRELAAEFRVDADEQVRLLLHADTPVVTIFPNEASLLRLATALLAEVSEEWETGRTYIRMDAE